MAISGTSAMFSRLTNLRNVVKTVGNTKTIAPSFNNSFCLATRMYSMDINSAMDIAEPDVKPKKKMSKAMKAYLDRAKEYEVFIKKEITEYQIGKRHLANMMGADPETFTQKDINEAIEYLFPSGLYDKRARPIMEAPEKIFPARKAAQFDESGRPFHSLFYTCKQNYHQVLYDIVANMNSLNEIEDEEMKKGKVPRDDDKLTMIGSEWMSKETLEKHLLESLHEDSYAKFLAAAERIAEHPYAFRIKDFLMQYRSPKLQQSAASSVLEMCYTDEGRPFVEIKECRRKTAHANVTVFGNGTGKITVNNKDMTYFLDIQSREQVSYVI